MSQQNLNNGYVNLSVSPKNKGLLLDNCKNEFLFHNPKFNGMKLTQDFLLGKIIEHYLKDSDFDE